MKILRHITTILLILLIAVSCEKDEETYSFDNLSAPTNVSVVFDVTQDNSGLVTIFPNADGATKYLIAFGDTIDETPTEYKVGEEITHVYKEGTYTVGITAVGIDGKKTSIEENLVVSFKVPENLEITVENDLVVSKQVNISATADYATLIEFYFGELAEADDTAVVTTPGETVSHIYENPGDYQITVIAKSGAIETLDSTFTFTVTEITGPQVAAPTPPDRVESDYISIFSDAYTNLTGTNFNPNWGQSTIVTQEEVVEGDMILKYTNLNYQGTQFENPIDASGMEYLHVDMWTEDATSVKFYTIDGVAEKGYELAITPETWVSYDIPLSYFDNVDLSSIIQFKVDDNGTGEGATVYFDNIYFYKPGASTKPSLPLNFESTTINYEFTDFGNVSSSIVNNPDATGINTSSKVAKSVKPSGAEIWAGTFLTMESPIDFSTSKTFKVKVYSPKSGATVKLKVENLTDGNISFEADATTSVTNEWEELTFDFSGINTANEYQKVVIFFDFGNAGDDSEYFFDDIKFASSSIENFEGAAPTFTVFGNIPDIEVVTNPDQSGANTTAKTAKMTKSAGAETWAGSFFELSSALDFVNYSKIKVSTWSPKSGITVKVKLENQDASITHEVDVTNTTADAWEDLVYDFSAAPAADYVRVVIFFDFGNSGDDSVYYYDEFELTD
ncbi:MAG: hypothetical protein ACP5DQ_08915 [Bacteroidales bacterium]